MRQPLVDSIQILQFCTLLECIQEHEDIVHTDTDDHEQWHNVQNPQGSNAKDDPVYKERQREAGYDGQQPKKGGEWGESAEDQHQDEDEYTTVGC